MSPGVPALIVGRSGTRQTSVRDDIRLKTPIGKR